MKISMKSRKIGYTYSSVSGYYSFRKSKSIQFESTLERDLLVLLEFSDSVFDVIEQPITIEYANKLNKKAVYTPDFLVHFNDTNEKKYITNISRKSMLIEVKPREILRKKFCELKPKFRAAIKYANENDMIFRVFDETKIRNAHFERIKFLKRYKALEYSNDYVYWVLNGLKNLGGSTSIENLLAFAFATDEDKNMALGCIYHLLANKRLKFFIDQTIDKDAQIWINEEYEDMNYDQSKQYS